jgi:hypothetical protein
MNKHCKTITRTPMMAETTPVQKMDAVIEAIQSVLTVLEESFVPFVSATVDAIVMFTRSLPWFGDSSL